MYRTLKSGQVVRIERQFRNMSNNFKENSRIWADLFRVKDANGKRSIVCETEIEEL